MKWLQWFTASTSVDTMDDVDRRQRYELGLAGVKQWYRARKSIANEGDQMLKNVVYARKTASLSQGANMVDTHLWQRVIHAQQVYTNSQLQAAEKRLIVYRNIVLMQGRI